ncbi:MAG TPA: Stk1 family PASTA domain-containing Ser/Thr kinase [Solirubrobacteraceae bacterium]
MTDAALGAIVDGRYKIVSRLGSGGMADVFLAEDQQLGRNVALKLLHRRFSADPDFVERFRREAQSAAGLQHPNVVSVYDRGAFDETYFIAMEYLPGRSLKQLIRQEAPLDPVRAIDITIQILKAARFAHRRGIIHRDLKPHNVIVDDSDHAKVTDFGIARAGASDMTETGSIMGTAQYLSPEQAQGHPVNASSDLYAVGVVLYEMLTGKVPFDGESPVTIALKHVAEAPAPLLHLNPGIPPELEHVVMWALNKNPDDRPQDADQLILALEQAKAVIVSGARGQHTASMAALAAVGVGAHVAAGAGTPLVPPPVIPPPGDGNGAGVLVGEPPPGDSEVRRRRPRWPWILLLLALLAGGGAAAAYLLTRPIKKPVPAVINENVTTASAVLQNQGFNVVTIDVQNLAANGTVIRQSPQPGTKVTEGQTVTLTVSTGPGSRNVPSVTGLPLKAAKAAMTRSELRPGRVLRESSNTIPAGDVTRTDPTAGQSLPAFSQVTIYVSTGRPVVGVPDVTGATVASAKDQLRRAGLSWSILDQVSGTATPGTVISENPAANSQVAPGTTIDLIVAKAEPKVAIPDVHNQTAAAAQSALTAQGFQVVERFYTVKKKSNKGIVLRESPYQGTLVKKGSTVTIYIGQYTPPTHP